MKLLIAGHVDDKHADEVCTWLFPDETIRVMYADLVEYSGADDPQPDPAAMTEDQLVEALEGLGYEWSTRDIDIDLEPVPSAVDKPSRTG